MKNALVKTSDAYASPQLHLLRPEQADDDMILEHSGITRELLLNLTKNIFPPRGKDEHDAQVLMKVWELLFTGRPAYKDGKRTEDTVCLIDDTRGAAPSPLHLSEALAARMPREIAAFKESLGDAPDAAEKIAALQAKYNTLKALHDTADRTMTWDAYTEQGFSSSYMNPYNPILRDLRSPAEKVVQ